MLTSFILLAGGLVYLLFGADFLVRGAVALARRASVPPIIVAITVVALGTSLPEMVVTLRAVLTGYPGIVLGNVVGSNIANVLLVGGAASIIYPLAAPDPSARRDTAVMMVVSILFVLLSVFGELTRTSGVVMLLGLAWILSLSARDATRAHGEAGGLVPTETVMGLPTKKRLIFLFIVLGLVGLPLGARFVVNATVAIAQELGMSEVAIGLTILAFGTSLPELATTVVAAVKKETDVAMGTIVGSNIFNLLAIMGLASVVSTDGIHVPAGFAWLDFPVMLAAAAAVTVYVWLGRPMGRVAGILMTASYLAYIAVLFATA